MPYLYKKDDKEMFISKRERRYKESGIVSINYYTHMIDHYQWQGIIRCKVCLKHRDDAYIQALRHWHVATLTLGKSVQHFRTHRFSIVTLTTKFGNW